MLARRMLVITLILIGMSVLAVSVEPPRTRVAGDEPAVRETPRPEPVPVEGDLDSKTISADDHGQRVVVELGRTLHLEVTASRPGSVQIGEDGPVEAVDPASPARFDLLADTVGSEKILLLDPRRAIGRLITRR